MSEKAPSPEKAVFKEKHRDWAKIAKVESASAVMGTTGGLLGMSMIAALGLLNPIALGIGGAIAAIAGYRFTKNEVSKM